MERKDYATLNQVSLHMSKEEAEALVEVYDRAVQTDAHLPHPVWCALYAIANIGHTCAAISRDPKVKPVWVVCIPPDNAHSCYAAARAEAERLSKTSRGGKFLVMRSVGAVSTQTEVQYTTHWEDHG